MDAQMSAAVGLPSKSVSEIRTRFCDTWRRLKSDDEFLQLLRDLTDGSLGSPTCNYRFAQIRYVLELSAGHEYYDISADTTYKLTE
jgi:hypothetical protein